MRWIPRRIEKPIHWNVGLIERFMIVIGPISTVFDVATFAVLLLIFHAGEDSFRTGWFIESLVTQILMIFSVRTRRHLFSSRPHRIVALLAFGTVALTLALPFLPGIGAWFAFVHPPAAYYVFLVAIVATFLVATELAKRFFYARIAPASGSGEHGYWGTPRGIAGLEWMMAGVRTRRNVVGPRCRIGTGIR